MTILRTSGTDPSGHMKKPHRELASAPLFSVLFDPDGAAFYQRHYVTSFAMGFYESADGRQLDWKKMPSTSGH